MTSKEENIDILKRIMLGSNSRIHKFTTYADIYYDKISSKPFECSEIDYSKNIRFISPSKKYGYEIEVSCNCSKFISTEKDFTGDYKRISCTTYGYKYVDSKIDLVTSRKDIEVNFKEKYIVSANYNHFNNQIEILKECIKNTTLFEQSIFNDNGTEEYYLDIVKKYTKLQEIL